MREPQTWRELLGAVIADPEEKQRLVDILRIHPITLTRWIQHKGVPRHYFLVQLLNALPQHREKLLVLLTEEFPELANMAEDDVPKEISAAFYARVISTYTTTPPSLRFWSISRLILEQILKDLDPDRLGMEIIVARCMPPSAISNKIRSLREAIGLGTFPWRSQLEEKHLFLGAESLAGYVVAAGHFAVIEDISKDQSFLPFQVEGQEKSAAAFPIALASRLAGCLLFSSTQINYFIPSRCALMQSYSDLMALAFSPDESYEAQQIELRTMPPLNIQQPYFASFRQRVTDALTQTAISGQPMTNQQAEQVVRQRLEEELLQLLPTHHMG